MSSGPPLDLNLCVTAVYCSDGAIVCNASMIDCGFADLELPRSGMVSLRNFAREIVTEGLRSRLAVTTASGKQERYSPLTRSGTVSLGNIIAPPTVRKRLCSRSSRRLKKSGVFSGVCLRERVDTQEMGVCVGVMRPEACAGLVSSASSTWNVLSPTGTS